jgi:hypothetical protein
MANRIPALPPAIAAVATCTGKLRPEPSGNHTYALDSSCGMKIARPPTAILAVLGYRIVNYWLPLMPGAIAYLRLRLSPGPGRPGKPPAPPAGR